MKIQLCSYTIVLASLLFSSAQGVAQTNYRLPTANSNTSPTRAPAQTPAKATARPSQPSQNRPMQRPGPARRAAPMRYTTRSEVRHGIYIGPMGGAAFTSTNGQTPMSIIYGANAGYVFDFNIGVGVYFTMDSYTLENLLPTVPSVTINRTVIAGEANYYFTGGLKNFYGGLKFGSATLTTSTPNVTIDAVTTFPIGFTVGYQHFFNNNISAGLEANSLFSFNFLANAKYWF